MTDTDARWPRNRVASFGFLAIVLATAFAAFAVSGGEGRAGILVAVSAVTTVVILVRVADRGAANRPAWTLLAAGQLLHTGAAAAWLDEAQRDGVSLTTVLLIASQAGFLAALVLFTRDWREHARIIDGIVVALGIGSIGWVVLEASVVWSGVSPTDATGPVFLLALDACVLALAAVLLTNSPIRTAALGLIVLWAGAKVTGDILLAANLLNHDHIGIAGLVVHLCAAAALGAGALHPTRVTAPTRYVLDDATPTTGLRLAMLGLGALLPIGSLIFETVRDNVDQIEVHASLAALIIVLILIRLSTLVVDMSEQRRIQRELGRMAAVVDSSNEAIFAVDRQGRVTAWNRAAERLFGYEADAALGRSILRIGDGVTTETEMAQWEAALSGRITEPLETKRTTADGDPVDIRLNLAPIRDGTGTVIGVSAVAGDITEQKELEQQLYHRAFHDELTGIPNRAYFLERLRHALQQRTPSPRSVVGVFLVDLDGFKAVNDTLGHEAGDQLLSKVAARLSTAVRDGDTVARMGGDEFAVLVEDLDLNAGMRTAHRLLDTLQEPIHLATRGRSTPITASIGVALVRHASDPSLALQQADVAMYVAKARGGRGYEVFTSTLHDSLIERHRLELELGGAADRGELLLHYQPVLNLKTNRPIAVEALLRWQHPDRGLLGPNAFIELAEDSGAILSIGSWVLDEACRQIATWDSARWFPDLKVAVNVSTRQLTRPEIIRDVESALERHGVAPERLTLETTETALAGDLESVIGQLERLRDLGVELALDDFGTGYSSLSYLRRLPFDVLKIDRSFVAGIARGSEEWSLAAAIVRLAQSLGKRTSAEGVETPAQLAHLRALGCELAQGYLFGPPMPADDLAAAFEQYAETRP